MLRPLKEIAKRLPYSLLLPLIYFWYWARDLHRARVVRRRLGIPLLQKVDLAGYKNSDTLCILGSGSSINRITAERWAAIARLDTVGFNFWLFHPFVPRMYFFETIPADDPFGRYQTFLDISSRRAAEYVETLKVASNLALGFACPPEWRGRLYTFEPVPVPARTTQEFQQGLIYLERNGMFDARFRISRLFKQASTLTSLIALAVAMRYRRVVLCGVDLTHSEFFFQDRELYPEWTNLEFVSREAPHRTNVPTPWHLPIVEILPVLRKQVLDPLGIEVEVESKDSALWPAFPYWEGT